MLKKQILYVKMFIYINKKDNYVQMKRILGGISMKTRGVKVIASILVFVLMFSYFSIMHKAVAVATNDILDNSIIAGENEMGNVQENTFLGTLATILGGEATATGNANVDFDVYLKNNGENVYNCSCENIR